MALRHAPPPFAEGGGLTLTDIARFCLSDDAVTYAAVCREWGVDPASEVEDPWLAMQLRVGLSDALRRHESEMREEQDKAHREERERQEHEMRIERAKRQLGI